MSQEAVLVVVGYWGGYGGQFFANVLRNEVEKKRFFNPINNSNEFRFETSVLGVERFSIESLLKGYTKGFDALKNVKLFEKMGNRKSIHDLYKRIFIDCYDDDQWIFCENLTNYYKKRLRLKPGFNVINAHYCQKCVGFSIHDLHDKVVFFLLMAKDVKHHMLFDLLGDIKQGHFKYPEFAKMVIEDLKTMPETLTPFDSCYPIEVGRMFLQTKDNGIEEAEDIISQALGIKISLDKEMIMNYSNSNVSLLNEFLDTDIEVSDFREVHRAAVRKLESLL